MHILEDCCKPIAHIIALVASILYEAAERSAWNETEEVKRRKSSEELRNSSDDEPPKVEWKCRDLSAAS